MKYEIERKYLVTSDGWRDEVLHGVETITQGYLSRHPQRIVRVRRTDTQGFITIKGLGLLKRLEYEYEIPFEDATLLLGLCPTRVVKTRYTLRVSGRTWEVDVFDGQNNGLVLAEVELKSDTEQVEKPMWVGLEVTTDARYTNSNLARHPYCE